MSWSGEEERAAAYRASTVAREANRRAREKAMHGDPAARTTLAERWAGFLEWLGERRDHPTDCNPGET